MANVFITRRIPRAGLELLAREGARVIIGQADEECALKRDALLGGVRDADVLLPLLTEAD